MAFHSLFIRRLYGLAIVGLLLVSFVFAALVVQVGANPLAVVSVTPADHSTNVPLKTRPVIAFDQPVNPSTLAGSVNGMPIVPFQAVFDSLNQTLKIDLGEMEYEKTYSVVISGNLEDTGGNKMGSDYAFSFTTATQLSKRPTSTINVPSIPQPGTTYTLTGKATGYTWQRDPDNPLELRHWDQYGNDIGDRPMLHPTALYFPDGEDGYKFYLIYTPYPGAADENPSLMRSNDGKTFTAVGVTNPLFKYNTQPIYDSQNLADPDAIKVGNTWMVFYEMEQTNYGHIGLQLSTDGLNYLPYGGPYDPARPTFPFPTDGNPVIHFSNDTWYEHDDNPADSSPRLGEPAAVFKDGAYHIWYSTYNTGGMLAIYANASDPRGPWTKLGPVLSPVGHSDVVYDPERNLYVMWYGTGGNNIATAPEPWGPWTKHPNNPIFTAQGGWEGSGLYRSCIVEVGTQWYLYYSANPGSNGMIGLAKEVPGIRKAEISTNGGLSWTQLTLSPDGSWSYPWTPTSRQTYSIQVRVTDDWMVGDPAEAIVNVGWPSQPANPILVVVNGSSGSFGEYTGEILRAEGLNEFQMTNLSQVTQSFLASFDTVILTTVSLSTAEATMFQDYVSGGGNLVAFKPDPKLATVFGLTSAGTTTPEGYIKIDDTTDIGKGIVNETIQFHGTADNYNLNGASVIATLYRDRANSTSFPAVTAYTYGYGQTVFFAYDLARSTVYLRQGNPAQANMETDGVGGLRGEDLLAGGWLDVRKVPIPQADEQMRLLSNAILRMNYYKKPLPRLWYFPNFEKTLFIMSGDSDGASTTQVETWLADIEARGGKTSFYMTSWESLANVLNWTARGHDIGWHPYPSGDYASWYSAYTSFVNAFQTNYGFSPTTIRHHSIIWRDYATPGIIQDAHGIRMDVNYYHYGPWLDPGDGFRNGWMTGSGLPMKFADENGAIYNSYQANTEFPDETMAGVSTGLQAAAIAASFFNLSESGYYSAFVGNFHPVSFSGERRTYGLTLMDYAKNYSVPILNAEQLLDFTDGKNKAAFENITYSAGQLNFNLTLPVETYNLTVLVPYEHEGRALGSIALDSVPKSFSTETIKGIKYAWFVVSSIGTYRVTANYGPDTDPPEITIVYPVNGAVLPAETTSVTITVETNEHADCKYNTTDPNFNYETQGTNFTLGQGTLVHKFTYSNVQMGQTYTFYYKANDTSGNINGVSTSHTFSVALEDKTPPEWANQGQSKSLINPGDSVILSAQGRDDYGLGNAILSTNEAGTWKNFTWWNTSWPYRKPITLTENSGSTLADFQVKLNIASSSHIKSDFSDLRFTAEDQMTPIPYWIESYTASISASVWVKVPTIPASGTTTIYLYYGNPSVTDAGNGEATMEFFDSFSGGTLDTNKWTVNAVNQISYEVNNYFRFKDATRSGITYFLYDGTDTGSQHQAKLTLPSQFIIEFISKMNDSASNQMGEGMIGLVASDNTLIGLAGHSDWQGDAVLPWRTVITENVATRLGSGVAQNPSSTNHAAYKTATSTDQSSWKIVDNGSALIFYDNAGFFAEAAMTSAVSKLALVAGTFDPYPFLDYVQANSLIVRKYASSDPSITVGAEDPYGISGTTGPWWNTSWSSRRALAITENSGSTLLDYQVKLAVSYASTMRTDFSDLRFTASDMVTPISTYWIESYVASTSAVVWVKMPTIPASGTTTIYMYYGNPSASDASNGPATFDFFDDFNDGSINATRWTTAGIVTETGGYMQVGTGGGTSSAGQNAANFPLFSRPYALRSRGLVSQTTGSIYIGLYDPSLNRFAFGPHSGYGYYTYDGTPQQTAGTGLTSYATYDILWTASDVKYYQDDVLRATHTNTPSASMGAYLGAYATTGYTRCDWILIRKYVPSEPTVSIGDQEDYSPPVMHYYHGSPKSMGDVAETWVWSNFTWYNPTILSGTTVAWKIWYQDTSGNWNSTGTMTFFVGTGQPTLRISPSLVEKSSGDVGTTFRVNATVESVVDLYGFDFNMTWDNTLIALASVDFNAALDEVWGNGNWYFAKNESGAGYYKLVAVSTLSGFNGTQPASLATLTFRVEDPHTNLMKETPIHFETHKLSDSNWTSITHTAEDGLYRITGRKPTLIMIPTNKICRMYNETFTVQVNVTDAGNVEDFRFEIRYNATLVDVAGVSWTAYGSGTYTADEINGVLTGYSSGGLINGNATLITITFNATYNHLWKDESTVPGWRNIQIGAIYIQWANLSYPSSADLRYERGGLSQIDAGPDFAYTFSPIPGDMDNNGVVDVFDLRTIAAFYDTVNPQYNLIGDAIVDIYDVVVVASNYGYTYIP